MNIKLDETLKDGINQSWAKNLRAEFEVLNHLVEKHKGLTVESVAELVTSMHNIGLNINVGNLMLLEKSSRVFKNTWLNFNITEYQPQDIEIFVEPYFGDETRKDLEAVSKFMDKNLHIIAKGFTIAKNFEEYADIENDYYWYFANR